MQFYEKIKKLDTEVLTTKFLVAELVLREQGVMIERKDIVTTHRGAFGNFLSVSDCEANLLVETEGRFLKIDDSTFLNTSMIESISIRTEEKMRTFQKELEITKFLGIEIIRAESKFTEIEGEIDAVLL